MISIYRNDIFLYQPATENALKGTSYKGNSLPDNQEKEEEATTDQSLESDSNYSEEESEYDPNENEKEITKPGANYMGSNTKGVYSQNGGKYTSTIRLNYVSFHGGTTTLASDSAHRHDLLSEQLEIPSKQKHFPHLKDYQAAREKEIQERGLTDVGSFESAILQAKQSIEAEIAKKRPAKDTPASSAASPQSDVSNDERRYIGSQPTRAEEIKKQPAFKPGEDCSFEWNVPVLNRRREGESLPYRDSSKRKREEESRRSHPLERKKAMWKHTMANKNMIQR